MRAWLNRRAPAVPLTRLTGARLTQAGAGTASTSMPASPWLMQIDSLEVTALASQTLELAVRTGVPPATDIQLMAFSVHHLRPANPDSGGIIARARVIHTGRVMTVAEVLVEDGSGRGVAHGTGSVATIPMNERPPDRPLPPVDEPRYSTPDPYLRPDAPTISPMTAEELGGAELVRRWSEGSLAIPICELYGFRPLDCGDGHASFAVPMTDWFCVDRGRVAPAVVVFLASASLHLATLTVQAPGPRLAPIHQTVKLLRWLRADGRQLLARSTVGEWDGRVATASAELMDADGNVVARADQLAMLSAGRRPQGAREAERVLATVMFTDVVRSTEQAERLGDSRWRALLDEHHAIVRKHLEMFKGNEVKTTGDGFLATFDSPGRAVQCARAVRDAIRRLGLEVRVGLHTGECEVSGADVAGIAVHIASRIEMVADAGEILVSGTVRDLVTGSGLRFVDRGRHSLKGIEGDWLIYALEG